MKVIVERNLPTPDALAALDAAVKAALPGKVDGLSSGPGWICVFLKAFSAEDENTARQVVLAHDMETRTAEQVEEAAIRTARADVIDRYLQSELADKTPTEIYTLMQTAANNLASLAEAKVFLAKWLPLMAAVCQIVLREQKQGG